jgi:hypothetical protein
LTDRRQEGRARTDEQMVAVRVENNLLLSPLLQELLVDIDGEGNRTCRTRSCSAVQNRM